MGNRVSTLWCKKTNLPITQISEETTNKTSEKSCDLKTRDSPRRASKRRFLQRRLSLNWITRESGTRNQKVEEPVEVHRTVSTLPRRLKLNSEEREVKPDLKRTSGSVEKSNSCEEIKSSSPPPQPSEPLETPRVIEEPKEIHTNISVDEVDAPPLPIAPDTYKLLTSTRTDLLTREKRTVNISSSHIARMKISSDLNINTSSLAPTANGGGKVSWVHF